MRRPNADAWVRATPVLWSLALAVLMLGGALGPGYVLSYDMVWVPDLAVRPDFLGLGSSLPRAVPSDLVVALLDEVVPGAVLQRIVLVGALVVAGTGAWRLVPGPSVVARLAATTLYVWNPFVAERLGIGHWPLLLTYAALPWIHRGARRLGSEGRGLPGLVLWVALASLSPVGGLMASLVAVVGVAASGRSARRATGWTVAAVAALNAPWILAGALHGSASVSDPAAVSLFAARGEGVLPVWAAVAGLGGIWNAEVVPGSRTSWVAVVSLVVVLAVAAAGVGPLRRLVPRRDRIALAPPAVLGVVVALGGAAAPGAVEWLVVHLPGAGLVRDGSRFVGLLAPVLAVLFGLGVSRVAEAVSRREVGLALGTVLVLSPVTLMPDAAAGISGRLAAVGFPDEYAAARAALEESRRAGHSGVVLSLPFTPYRRPGWNDGRRTLDPVGRYFPVDYLVSDTLVVSGQPIPGEDRRARRVGADLATLRGPALEQALAREGVGWVVLDVEAARALGASGLEETGFGADPDLGDARLLHEGTLLEVWELSPDEAGSREVRGPVGSGLLALGWAAALFTLAGAALSLATRRTT